MLFGFGPDHKHIRNGRVGDPHLGAGQFISSRRLLSAGLHACGIRACIGLGQTKATDPLTRGQLGQIFLALRFRAVGIDRIDHQAGLHGHHGTIARVHALHLARNQTVGDIVAAQPAVFFGQGDAQQAHIAHLFEDRRIGFLISKGIDHARLQLFLRIGLRGIADHAFIFRQLAVQAEGVGPVE